MAVVSTCAESVIGSLCKEIDCTRGRAAVVLRDLLNCRNEGLRRRLRQEWLELQRRQTSILNLARSWRESSTVDSLSIEFLMEVCSRPLVTNQYP
jgi:hypothetical protein